MRDSDHFAAAELTPPSLRMNVAKTCVSPLTLFRGTPLGVAMSIEPQSPCDHSQLPSNFPAGNWTAIGSASCVCLAFLQTWPPLTGFRRKRGAPRLREAS